MKRPGDGVINRAPNNRVCKVLRRRDVADRDARINQEIHLRVQACNGRMEVDGKLIR
jgi:hypothetical protein